jgi:hypothetical protein
LFHQALRLQLGLAVNALPLHQTARAIVGGTILRIHHAGADIDEVNIAARVALYQATGNLDIVVPEPGLAEKQWQIGRNVLHGGGVHHGFDRGQKAREIRVGQVAAQIHVAVQVRGGDDVARLAQPPRAMPAQETGGSGEEYVHAGLTHGKE